MRSGVLVLILLLAACSPANEGGGPQETTGASGEEIRVRQIAAGAPGQGPRQPHAVVAPSAAALSEATGLQIPDSGSGVYLAVYWGRKPTGGYSLSVESARLRGDGLVVELALREPPPDAMVTQALTYPYAVAVVRGADQAGRRDVVFVDRSERELGWPVRRATG